MEIKAILDFGKSKIPMGLAFALVGLALPVSAANYYVSPTGNNTNAGSKDQPFATIDKGQTTAVAGDTVFFRGGDYKFVSSTNEIGITLNKSGASGKLIHYVAYPGEVPVFDFYGMTAQKRIKGVVVTGNWLHLKGIEMKGVPQSAALQAHEDWCIWVNGGSNNIFENLNIHHNMGPGLFIQDGGNNYVLNCDSHDNYDANSYTNGALNPGENADGFGVHVKSESSTGNHFYGCRSWFNADDGWDFISCLASVTVENCWAWGNGYKTGTNPPQSAGNGNGFKVGGFGATADGAPNPVPQHTVRFCLAFNNKAAGFYQNHHPISNFYYNNTSYNNKSTNFNLLGYKGGDASLGILRNNIAFMGTLLSNDKTGNGLDAVNNTWNLSLSVTAADFQGTDTTGVGGPRQADGSLPNLAFMKLKASSGLIDKGINVNLPYNGAAPDMGGFEYGITSGVKVSRQASRTGNTHSVLHLQGDGYDISGRFQSLVKPTQQLLIPSL